MTIASHKWLNSLELIDALHALWLFIRVDKAAKRSPELLATRPMRHTSQTWTVPIDLAGFWVECSL